jgi:hypothetical protein
MTWLIVFWCCGSLLAAPLVGRAIRDPKPMQSALRSQRRTKPNSAVLEVGIRRATP